MVFSEQEGAILEKFTGHSMLEIFQFWFWRKLKKCQFLFSKEIVLNVEVTINKMLENRKLIWLWKYVTFILLVFFNADMLLKVGYNSIYGSLFVWEGSCKCSN